MELRHVHLDLGPLGDLHTYDMSGEAGTLDHELAPLQGDRVAIFIAEGFHLIDALTVTVDGGDAPLNRNRYRYREYTDRNGLTEAVSIVAMTLPQTAGIAHLRFFGGRPVGLHVLTIARRDLSAKGILEAVFQRFMDRCWVCMRLVRALCSALIGGIDIDADDIEDALRILFPDEWIPDLPDTDLRRLLRRILDRLRQHDPRRILARKLCEELGFCP